MLRTIFAFALFFLWGLNSRADDWPQFQGPTQDGTSKERIEPWKAEPKILWKQEVGQGWSGPIVAAGKVFIFHRQKNREVLQCLEAGTGKEIWSQDYPATYRDDFGFDEGPRSTPIALPKENIVITLGADGDLYGRAFDTGKALWQRNINKDYKVKKSYFGVGTSPRVAGGKLLLNVGAKGAGIVAFDPATGNELWKSGDDEVSYSTPVIRDLDGEPCAIFFTRRGLQVLRVKDGESKYSYPWRPRNPASVSAASPIVKGKQIFLTTSYATGALLVEVSAGAVNELWKGDDILSAHFNTPILFSNFLIGIEGRQETGAKLRCIDWATGKIHWTEEGFGCASLLRADNRLLALNEKGMLYLIEPDEKQYKELARAKILEPKCRAAIALADGRLYARDEKQLICVELGKK